MNANVKIGTTAYNCFVTGATGFVGQAFLKRIRREPDVRLLLGCRYPREDALHGWSGVTVDLTRPLSLPPVPLVIHMAAEKRDVTRMQAVNVEGTRNLLAWAAENGVRRFVYLSSVGTYGAGPRAGLVCVGRPPAPRNAYEQSKQAAENLVLEMCGRAGIQAVILQPSNVVGVNSRSGWPLLGLMRAVKADRFVYISRTDSYVNYVAVEDVAECLTQASQLGLPEGTFIVNTPALLREFVECIADDLKVAAPRRHMSRGLALTLGCAFSTIGHLSSHVMPFDMNRVRELCNQTVYDGGVIESAFSFAYPVGWRKMLRNLIATYQQMGLL